MNMIKGLENLVTLKGKNGEVRQGNIEWILDGNGHRTDELWLSENGKVGQRIWIKLDYWTICGYGVLPVGIIQVDTDCKECTLYEADCDERIQKYLTAKEQLCIAFMDTFVGKMAKKALCMITSKVGEGYKDGRKIDKGIIERGSHK